MRGRAGEQADAVFGAGVQRGWEACVCEHGFADGRSEGGGEGEEHGECGVVVYGFADGKITPERMIPIPLQKLAAGAEDGADWRRKGDDRACRFRRRLRWWTRCAVAEELLVADNLSDDVLLIDAATGKIETAVRSVGERCGAGDLSGGAGGFEGWDAGVCGAVECERGGGTRSDEGDGGAEACAAEAERSGGAGDASVCAGDFVRMGRRCMWRWRTGTRWRRWMWAAEGSLR